MIRRRQFFSVILIYFILSLSGCLSISFAQNNQQVDDEQANRQLEELRREILEFEKRITESKNREKNLLDELEDFDREIALRNELLTNLRKERNKTQKSVEKKQSELNLLQSEISKNQRDSSRTSDERDSLAALVNRRAIYSYKHHRRDALKAIMTSVSLVQMLTRQEYIKRIAEADRNNLLNLQKKNQELNRIGVNLSKAKSEKNRHLDQLRRDAQYKERLIQEENSETALLKKRRRARESLLKKIRNDQDLLRKQLADKKLAAQRIENMIRSLELQREDSYASPGRTWSPDIPFSQLKGKLNWPTLGKVVSKFGLQRHKRLDTITENPGIEIESEEGSPVTAVGSGQVTRITWLRGYGNTVIIDHQEGYYTVYAHLVQITVREGQVVHDGDVIGRVGQTGSLEGPRLHFEIWAKREKQDPLSWLKLP